MRTRMGLRRAPGVPPGFFRVAAEQDNRRIAHTVSSKDVPARAPTSACRASACGLVRSRHGSPALPTRGHPHHGTAAAASPAPVGRSVPPRTRPWSAPPADGPPRSIPGADRPRAPWPRRSGARRHAGTSASSMTTVISPGGRAGSAPALEAGSGRARASRSRGSGRRGSRAAAWRVQTSGSWLSRSISSPGARGDEGADQREHAPAQNILEAREGRGCWVRTIRPGPRSPRTGSGSAPPYRAMAPAAHRGAAAGARPQRVPAPETSPRSRPPGT